MVQIIPSILTADLEEYQKLLRLCQGKVERAHIDFIDGIYAPNKTLSVAQTQNQGFADLQLDAHLMLAPSNLSEGIATALTTFNRVIFHIESAQRPEELLASIKDAGKQAGLAVDLDTKVSVVEKMLSLVDVILIMSVPAGFGGQKFNLSALDKISWLAKKRAELDLNFAIQDDGGITLENVDDTHYLGADEVVIGRRLFSGDLAENLQAFQEAAHTLML